MVRSIDFSRCFRHGFTAWRTTFVVGVAAAALGGCGVDRTGLEKITVPDDAGNHPGNGDAAVVADTAAAAERPSAPAARAPAERAAA